MYQPQDDEDMRKGLKIVSWLTCQLMNLSDMNCLDLIYYCKQIHFPVKYSFTFEIIFFFCGGEISTGLCNNW